MGYRSRVGAFLKFAMSAARRAANLEGDVVFASSTPLTIALPAAYAAWRKRIPMVFEVRDLWPEMPIAVGALKNPLLRLAARWLERFAYTQSARVVALSPGMAAGVARSGYPGERIEVVPNGSDIAFFVRNIERGRALRQRLGISDEKIVVGYAGTLGRINGVGYLVHVAAALKADQRFVFLLIGEGQEREEIETAAREHGVLNGNLIMRGKIAKAEMADVFSTFDVATSLFLPIPEMESNSANKFFDALAAGCCVAINYGGWQAELLNESGAGVRLSSNPQLAARQLQSLAEDPERLKAAGLEARRLAVERFSWDELAARVESVLAEAIAEE
jgi:glycosyltransferase involved in cell wall biosynthesis